MVFPWCFHGVSMVFPWFCHGFPWSFPNFSMPPGSASARASARGRGSGRRSRRPGRPPWALRRRAAGAPEATDAKQSKWTIGWYIWWYIWWYIGILMIYEIIKCIMIHGNSWYNGIYETLWWYIWWYNIIAILVIYDGTMMVYSIYILL